MKAVIQHLRNVALLHKSDSPSDGQLLEAFLTRREEAAFTALLRRHGPMVMGVCRRVLRNSHDAEDAFQATFLVLARKAATVKPRDMVGNWLYGVACRTAMKARAMSVKRRAKESQAKGATRAEPSGNGSSEELLARLDYELSRLHDKYRVPIVLCELEGKPRKEAARLLGLPEGTLSWRLAHAKKLLARRLSRYGTLAVAALLAESAASAQLSPALLQATVQAVLKAVVVPGHVVALTEGVLKAMFLTKLKMTVCAAGLMLLAGLAATGLTSYRATAQQPMQETSYYLVRDGRSQADDLEALRLEIEALRKSLQATRERVKSLEQEVNVLKGQRGGSSGAIRGAGPQGITSSSAEKGQPRSNGPGLFGPKTETRPDPRGGADAKTDEKPHDTRRSTNGSSFQSPSELNRRLFERRMGADDPLVAAEAALTRLRRNPDDKEAADALEHALKRMKAKEQGSGLPPRRVN